MHKKHPYFSLFCTKESCFILLAFSCYFFYNKGKRGTN